MPAIAVAQFLEAKRVDQRARKTIVKYEADVRKARQELKDYVELQRTKARTAAPTQNQAQPAENQAAPAVPLAQ